MNKTNTLKCSNKDCPHSFNNKCDHKTVISKEMICLSIKNSAIK